MKAPGRVRPAGGFSRVHGFLREAPAARRRRGSGRSGVSGAPEATELAFQLPPVPLHLFLERHAVFRDRVPGPASADPGARGAIGGWTDSARARAKALRIAVPVPGHRRVAPSRRGPRSSVDRAVLTPRPLFPFPILVGPPAGARRVVSRRLHLRESRDARWETGAAEVSRTRCTRTRGTWRSPPRRPGCCRSRGRCR